MFLNVRTTTAENLRRFVSPLASTHFPGMGEKNKKHFVLDEKSVVREHCFWRN